MMPAQLYHDTLFGTITLQNKSPLRLTISPHNACVVTA